MKKLLSFISKKISISANWLNKDYELIHKVSFSSLIKILVSLIPLYGILYLPMFYSHFNVNYFLYFNPMDFLRIFYYNNTYGLYLMLALSFVFVHLFSVYRKNNKKLPLRLIFLIVSIFIVFIGSILIYNSSENLRNMFILIFILIFAANVSFVYYKYVDTLIYHYASIFLLFSLTFSKYQAVKIETRKLNFDIILNDDSYLLKETEENSCSYFVGNVTNYVFIYDCSLDKMRAVPIKNIKEIRFKKR